MKGQILDYSIQKNAGVITAEDGMRYKFEGAEWHADMQPTRGASVDFDIENGMAVGIYRSLNSAPSRASKSNSPALSVSGGKSKTVAAMFALFLGVFGAHKFYTGAWGWGIAYVGFFFFFIILSLIALGAGSGGLGVFFGLLTYIPAIAAIVECIRYFVISDDDFNEKVNTGTVKPFTFIW